MYEDKVKQVVSAIGAYVQFDNIEQAREYHMSYKLPESAPVVQEIHRMAENFTVYPARFGVAEFINPRAAHRTTTSMFREAIRLCAERYVHLWELKELALIGDLDRRPPQEDELDEMAQLQEQVFA